MKGRLPENRRRFILNIVHAVGFAVSFDFLLSACSPSKEKVNEYHLKSCQDLSQVSDSELAKRKQFAYETQAGDPLKTCANCKLYLPPKPGEACGACTLFKGPVEAEGSCTYWAPLEVSG